MLAFGEYRWFWLARVIANCAANSHCSNLLMSWEVIFSRRVSKSILNTQGLFCLCYKYSAFYINFIFELLLDFFLMLSSKSFFFYFTNLFFYISLVISFFRFSDIFRPKPWYPIFFFTINHSTRHINTHVKINI